MARKVAARKTGVVVELESAVQSEDNLYPLREEAKDHFVLKDGLQYAGTHLLVDLWGAKHLDDADLIETALKECITTCGATLLYLHLHCFSENGGISGVAVLSESHISIHTWPERDYAAIDIFMCGDARPHKAIPILRRHFQPTTVQLAEQKRGLVE
jgi:S-adenosylmethionine decarboxylase